MSVDVTRRPKVLLLAPAHFEFLELAAFLDVMGWSGAVDVVTASAVRMEASEEGEEEKAATSVPCTFATASVVPKLWLTGGAEEADRLSDDYDAVAMPGGMGKFGFNDAACAEPYASLIRAFDDKKKFVTSICAGALMLAHAGVLKGRVATAYRVEGETTSEDLEILRAAGATPDPSALLVVSDGRVITSRGPSSAIPVGFKLLSLLTSDDALVEQTRIKMNFTKDTAIPTAGVVYSDDNPSA